MKRILAERKNNLCTLFERSIVYFYRVKPGPKDLYIEALSALSLATEDTDVQDKVDPEVAGDPLEQAVSELNVGEEAQGQLNVGEENQGQLDVGEEGQGQVPVGVEGQEQLDVGEEAEEQLDVGEQGQGQLDVGEEGQGQVDEGPVDEDKGPANVKNEFAAVKEAGEVFGEIVDVCSDTEEEEVPLSPPPSLQMSPETFKKLSRNNDGPLATSHMPRASVLVIDEDSMVASIHPWNLDLWNSKKEMIREKEMVKVSIPIDFTGVVARRRRAVVRNYRSGKMYAILRDGRVAMSPSRDIQSEVDTLNKNRGGDLVLQTWMEFVEMAIIRKEETKANSKSKEKKNKSVKEKKNKKRKATSQGKGKGKAIKSTNPFDIDDFSDENSD